MLIQSATTIALTFFEELKELLKEAHAIAFPDWAVTFT